MNKIKGHVSIGYYNEQYLGDLIKKHKLKSLQRLASNGDLFITSMAYITYNKKETDLSYSGRAVGMISCNHPYFGRVVFGDPNKLDYVIRLHELINEQILTLDTKDRPHLVLDFIRHHMRQPSHTWDVCLEDGVYYDFELKDTKGYFTFPRDKEKTLQLYALLHCLENEENVRTY